MSKRKSDGEKRKKRSNRKSYLVIKRIPESYKLYAAYFTN